MQEVPEERIKEGASTLAALAASLEAETTKRQKLEGQLRESQQQYRLVVKAAKGAIWDWDLVTNQVQWNEEGKTLFGYSTGITTAACWLERLHPGDREKVMAGIQATLNSTGNHWSDEYRHRRADGSYTDVFGLGYIVRGKGENALRMTGSMLDVSERKTADRALRENEKQYRILFDDSPLPMVVFDPGTLEYLAVNTAAEELFGYTREEFLAMTLRDTRTPEEVPRLLDFLKTVDAVDAFRSTFISQCKDGKLLNLEVNGRKIHFGERIARLALITDITERKHLEAQLQHAQKMEAVGRLAGGIAHDFNNLLTVILGYSDGILRQLEESDDALRRKVSEIQVAGQRAANLTSQLLAFSRKQILQIQALNLNPVVLNISQMVRRLLGEDIQITLHLDAAFDRIHADPTQLEQVLVNLSINARDAMPHGGQLMIETHNAEVTPESAALQGIPSGRYSVLVVSDTGCGMDEATKAKAFEPFFTTKEIGKGTGLGLSMVLGAVQQSGGTVTVYSEPGVGTAFRIYLPTVDTPAEQFKREEESKSLPAACGATILLVEDEDRVRGLAREVLQDAGYIVIEARNGREALRIAESCSEAPALVLTDVIMPEMSGQYLAEQLCRHWPGLPIVYTSGYTDHALLARSSLRRDSPFLQKPYTPGALLDQIASALERT